MLKEGFLSEPSHWIISMLAVCYGALFVVWGLEKGGLIGREITGVIYLSLLGLPLVATPFVLFAINRRHRIEMAKVAARAQQRS